MVKVLFSVIQRAVERCIAFAVQVFYVVATLLFCWRLEKASTIQLKRRMHACRSYQAWRGYARLLDEEEGLGTWRDAPEKRINLELLTARVRMLSDKRRESNAVELIKALRADIHRSTYGITNPSLYPYRTAAKTSIATYVNVMTHMIRSMAADNTLEVPARYRALSDMDLAYGRSALFLNGGVALGAYHLGVVKGLYEAKLLPKILFGCNTGALVAACLCCFDDITPVLDGTGVNFDAFAKRGASGSLQRKWHRLLNEGTLMDVGVLLQFAKDNVGDMTFDDAYKKTGRILNINVTIHKEGSRNVGSWLMNYISTPNVLVYSAAVASCATPYVYGSTPIVARSISGKIVPFDPPGIAFCDKVVDFHINDAVRRLQELFHVKLAIVSECTVSRLPFVRLEHRTTLLPRIGHFVTEEMWRLLAAVSRLPWFQSRVTGALQNMSERIIGDVVIYPASTPNDLLKLLQNPDQDLLNHCIWRGQQQLWPQLPLLKAHIAIEMALYDSMRLLQSEHPQLIHQDTRQGSPLPSSRRRPSVVAYPMEGSVPEPFDGTVADAGADNVLDPSESPVSE